MKNLKNYDLFLIKLLKIIYKKFKKILFTLLFKNLFMQYPFYRDLMNKFYRFFFYNAFLEPKEEYLLAHNNHQYLKGVEIRSKNKKLANNSIPYFHLDFDNSYKGFFKVDIKKMSSDNGSRFSSIGDPLCKTALQLINNKNLKIRDLFLYKYFQKFQPKSISEVFMINKQTELEEINSYNRFFPWHTPYPPPEHQNFFFGPKIKLFDEISLRRVRLLNIIELVKKYGYIPDDNDCIDGYVLINKNDYRFVVTGGHHRSSVLNALNILEKFPDHVIVRFDQERVPNNYFIIDKKEVKNWPSVKNNFITEKSAISIFDSFFIDKKYF